jgi:hypothetical protein
MLYGTLEAGGTKMVLSVGNENNEILEQETIPTEAPGKTIPAMIAWFAAREISALGIGTFGPVDLNPASPTYGFITQTPKPGWRNIPLLPPFRDALNIPVNIDTDVNAAALAEWQLGAAKGLNSCLYVTVGTGIGAGLVVVLFALLVMRGYWISMHARDRFGALLSAGLTTLIGLQVLLNIGVVTNLLPSTGISLPFFSYGGSNLWGFTLLLFIFLRIDAGRNLVRT